eukprot:TRINITY_DN34647_c0_g1_i1.p1 TRINITY_DN34647_c0_g1~~TRINITY_DN34647_c0_g1_i1.p1  ORF type:complete len:263 (+),score=22.48 TRINITY_DN34647_c0_g1_i1:74-790(+)
MVVPLGPMPAQQEVQVPDVVKEKYSTFWWAVGALLVAAAVGQAVAGDVFEVFYLALIAGIVIYSVKDNCKNMNMCCVLMLGVICTMQALFELISLCSQLGGRTERQLSSRAVSGSTTEYTTSVTTHPFFDASLGLQYNVQSAMMIARPVLMILAALLAYFSYQAYPTPLFSEDADSESGGIYSQGGYRSGGNGNSGSQAGYGSGGYGGSGGRPYGGAQQSNRSSATRIFGGSGQRLGS